MVHVDHIRNRNDLFFFLNKYGGHQHWGQNDCNLIKLKLANAGINMKFKKDLCEPRQFGKAHRKQFGTRASKSLPGYLLFADVCGPFDTSFHGWKYLILLKDHYIHFLYGFIEKKKSALVLSRCIHDALAKTSSLSHKVFRILIDNGDKFDEQVHVVLSEFGVTQWLTTLYTPKTESGMK